MNLLPIALLISGACQAPLPALGSSETSAAALPATAGITRVYDLSSLYQRTNGDEVGDLVFPLLTPYSDADSEFEVHRDLDFSKSLLRVVLAGDFESDGVLVEDIGDSRLVVNAPAAVHQRIEAAIQSIEGLVSARIDLELCAVRLPEGSQLSAGLMADAAARDLIEAAGREGGLERLRLRLGSGLPAVLDVGHEQTIVANYEVEVAEGAFCYEPQVYSIFLGSRLHARAAEGKDGTFVSLALRRASALGEPVSREVERGAQLLANDVINRFTDTMLHESQAVLGRALAINAFLPEGRALVCVLGHARAGVREALIVRRVGGELPIARQLAAGPGSRALTVLDVTRWAPPVVHGGLRDVFGSRPIAMPVFGTHDEGIWQVSQASYPEIDAEENLPMALEYAGYEYEDREGGWPLLAVSLTEGAEQVLERLEPFAPDQRNVIVDLQLIHAGATLARISAPVLAGQSSEALICSEDLLVAGAEVEIAKYSSVEAPYLRKLLEGLFVRLEPSFGPSGDVSLGVFGAGVRVSGARRSFSSTVSGTGQIESAPKDYLFVDERLRFAAGGGTGVLQLGDSAGGLMLAVSVRVP